VLSYLVDITGDVQSAINNLNSKTTNITYNPTGNITTINDNVIVNSINNVSSTVLSYLVDITGDVQSAINNLNTKTTNITYNPTGNITTINDNLIVNSINNISSTVLSYLVDITGDVQSAINNLNSITTNITYNPTGNITTINDNLLANYVNGVAQATFSYLVDITQDVEVALDNLQLITTNMSYDSINNVTYINDYFTVSDLSTSNNLAISNNCAISGELTVNQINSQNMLINSINSQSLSTNQIICNGTFSSYSDIGCYLYVLVKVPSVGQETTSLLTIPLMKSQLVSNLFVASSPFIASVTLKNNYSIAILDSSGTIQYSLSNTTNDFIYNKSAIFNALPYKINIFINNILL
jgi:flagellar biosynthesis/type III secretory pathway chaperone